MFEKSSMTIVNMATLFVVLLLLTSSAGSDLPEEETCVSSQLQVCIDRVPRTRIGLPRNKEELDAHCSAYNIGMSCMNEWMKRCLPTDGQKIIQRQIAGAQILMRYLCSNGTAVRKEYLKEPACLAMVSAEWSACVDRLQITVRDIAERSPQIVYFNRNSEFCCARDEFLSCVSHAARACSARAGTVLRRIAWVLAQDVAACSNEPGTHCAASPPPVALTAPLLTVLYTLRFQ
ncbi:PREDICTED: uncharacterized protein LOC106103008 [Papilio polytes]|uniref:uncharacterized protein LOC106103008 n=1 Tax=Papilio polytes TaxID=76194 RepID=UPI000676371B|nr:PREDICTED: uncharacterized protein LOC106103008 [Papilio polytes]